MHKLNFWKGLKKCMVLISILFLGSSYASAQLEDLFITPTPPPESLYYGEPIYIDDGTYWATVYYESHTGYRANYKLAVKVRGDNVVTIYFENGGYLHPGSSNYRYFDGKLLPQYDYLGNLIALKGTVRIETYNKSSFLISWNTDYYTIVIQ